MVGTKICPECGKLFEFLNSEHVCKSCKAVYEKRNEIRNAINVLKKYAEVEKYSKEFHGLSGFSHAEMEMFSISLKHFQVKFDLPNEADYFVNEKRKEQFIRLTQEY